MVANVNVFYAKFAYGAVNIVKELHECC